MQSEALADLMAELSSTYATKHDLKMLEERLENKIGNLRTDLAAQISALEARLTWRFVALTVFLGTVLSLVNIFAA